MELTINLNDKEEVIKAIGLLKKYTGTKDIAVDEPVMGQKSTKTKSEGVDLPKDKKPLKKAASENSAEGSITIEVLKERAKEKAKKVGREKVKEVINEFAPMLSEVKEEDYGKLYKQMGEL